MFKTGILGAAAMTCALTMPAAADRSSNDDCADAFSIAIDSSALGSTVGETADEVGTCVTTNTAPGVWYSFIGNGCDILVTTCSESTNYDTKLSVFSGSCGALVCEGGNDDSSCSVSFLQSNVVVSTLPGVEYLILVHGFGTATGDFELTLEDLGVCSVANDDCANAIPVALNSTTPGTTTDSTFDGVGFCGTDNSTGGVWYSFIGDGSSVEVTTCSPNTNYDSKISVFTGSCGGLVCVDGDDDDPCPHSGLHSRVYLCSTTPGTEYLILVHGFDSNTGDFDLTVSTFPQLTNDDACDAIPLAMGSSTPFSGVCATVEADEPSPGEGTDGKGSCNSTDGWCSFETAVNNSVWYSFVAPDCGGVEIEVSIGDYQLAVWSALACNMFVTYTEIAANDDSGPGLAPRLELCDLTPGQTYLIQVDGFAGTRVDSDIYIGEWVCNDCNNNGIDDQCEIDAGLAFDCNCNGVPDECDLQDPFMDMNNDGLIDSCTLCAGDTNCDGRVDYLDILNVFNNLGSSGPLGDVNYDGVVNAFDYYIVAWNYGKICL